LLVLVAASSAFAQSAELPTPPMFKAPAPGTGDVTAQKLLADRVAFAKEMYQLNPEQTNKVVPLLEKMLPEQEKHDAKTRLTLRRLKIAISVAATEPESAETDRTGTMATLQNQLNAIQGTAPLSFSNVTTAIEPLLPKEQLEAARGRIKADLAKRLKRDAAAIDLKQIDSLLTPTVIPEPLPALPPVHQKPMTDQPPRSESKPLPPTPPPVPQQPPAPAQPASPPVPPVPAQPTTKPATPPLPPLPRSPEPAQVPRVIKPAPPEATWTKDYEDAVKKYGFTDDQKKIAEKALKSTLDRAAAYREKNKEEFKKAQAITEPGPKTDAMKKLNEPLDKLYDEMIQRVEAIATMEQHLRSEGKLVTPRTPPTSGPATVPAAPVPVDPHARGAAPAAPPTPPLPRPTPVPAQPTTMPAGK
jgi:hypothetical protein